MVLNGVGRFWLSPRRAAGSGPLWFLHESSILGVECSVVHGAWVAGLLACEGSLGSHKGLVWACYGLAWLGQRLDMVGCGKHSRGF